MTHPTPTPSAAGAAEAHPQKLISFRHREGRGAAFGLSQKQRGLVERVAGMLRDGGYQTERTSCVCGHTEASVISQVDRYGLPLSTVLCAACGTLRFDPYLGPTSLADFYTHHYQDMYGRVPKPDPYFERQRGYGERLLGVVRSTLQPGARVLEVGCGAGGALAVFSEAGFDVCGCDYSTPLIEHGRTKGLQRLAYGDLADARLALGLAPGSVDLIFLHHVFEHLISPVDWLRSAQELLTPQGLIVVAVPDAAEIDRYDSPGGDLRLFLHVAHKFNFTMKGLEAAAQRAGTRAHSVAVPRSKAAPEIWVAFGTAGAALPQAAVWQGSGAELDRRLRAIERRYLIQGGLRKLKNLVGLGAR